MLSPRLRAVLVALAASVIASVGLVAAASAAIGELGHVAPIVTPSHPLPDGSNDSNPTVPQSSFLGQLLALLGAFGQDVLNDVSQGVNLIVAQVAEAFAAVMTSWSGSMGSFGVLLPVGLVLMLGITALVAGAIMVGGEGVRGAEGYT